MSRPKVSAVITGEYVACFRPFKRWRVIKGVAGWRVTRRQGWSTHQDVLRHPGGISKFLFRLWNVSSTKRNAFSSFVVASYSYGPCVVPYEATVNRGQSTNQAFRFIFRVHPEIESNSNLSLLGACNDVIDLGDFSCPEFFNRQQSSSSFLPRYHFDETGCFISAFLCGFQLNSCGSLLHELPEYYERITWKQLENMSGDF